MSHHNLLDLSEFSETIHVIIWAYTPVLREVFTQIFYFALGMLAVSVDWWSIGVYCLVILYLLDDVGLAYVREEHKPIFKN